MSKIQILSSLCGGLSKSFVLEPEMVVWESRELYLDHNVQAFKFNLWMLGYRSRIATCFIIHRIRLKDSSRQIWLLRVLQWILTKVIVNWKREQRFGEQQNKCYVALGCNLRLLLCRFTWIPVCRDERREANVLYV